MKSEQLSIEELAESAGLTRRAVRFYIQQQLIPPPARRGRGARYDTSHLKRLQRILDLRQSGYSLDAIRKLLDGAKVPKPAARRSVAGGRQLAAELWTRIRMLDGVELHYDAAKHHPQPHPVLALREQIRKAFMKQTGRHQLQE
jgi:DNA-binding transcriptional MerR regulator